MGNCNCLGGYPMIFLKWGFRLKCLFLFIFSLQPSTYIHVKLLENVFLSQ